MGLLLWGAIYMFKYNTVQQYQGPYIMTKWFNLERWANGSKGLAQMSLYIYTQWPSRERSASKWSNPCYTSSYS